jgi:succinoglycan biosynthesis protein ExoA
MADEGPAVSVVMPVLNEARDVERLLLEVLNQIPPPGGFEVLVADGGSTDGTRAIVADLAVKWPSLTLLDNPGRLSSSGRNVGARAARGKYLLYLDGHCFVPRQDYLVRLVDLFETTGAACLCRPQPLYCGTEGGWARSIATARHSWLGHDVGSDIYGGAPGFTDPRSAGAAYRTEVVVQLGGYDERFDACEDVEFNCRVRMAGLQAYRHPDLEIGYRPRTTLGGLFRQIRRYGRGRARLFAKHHHVVPWPLVSVTIVTLAVLVALVVRGPHLAGTMAAALAALWLAISGLEAVRTAKGFAAGTRVYTSLVVIHAGLIAGFWSGITDFGRFRSRGGGGTGPVTPGQA